MGAAHHPRDTDRPRPALLPCGAAGSIPGLGFSSVRDHALADIWSADPAFLLFRDARGLREPCRSRPERDRNFGGCRCQAAALTGDASAADPACALSPDHDRIVAARFRADDGAPLAYRGRR